jgi:hypothetical protein
MVSGKDRMNGTMAKENSKLLKGEGKDDYIWNFQGYFAYNMGNLLLFLMAVVIQTQKSFPKEVNIHALKAK